jgi:hypothetical protein
VVDCLVVNYEFRPDDFRRKRRDCHAEQYNNSEQNNETDNQRYAASCEWQIALL